MFCPQLGARPTFIAQLVTVLCQDGARLNGRDPFFQDGERCACQIFMSVFEKFDVLGHVWVLPPPIFHGLLEVHSVDVLYPPAVHCDVVGEI